jgi:hypothetical protein
MRIIALLFAFVLAGCTGNRLNSETKPIAVALCAPTMAATFAASVPSLTDDSQIGVNLQVCADEENRTDCDRRGRS